MIRSRSNDYIDQLEDPLRVATPNPREEFHMVRIRTILQGAMLVTLASLFILACATPTDRGR